MVHFTGKSAQTDPKITSAGARSNSTHMATTYGYYIYSPNAEFFSISFYDEPFLSYEPILNDLKLP